LGGTAVARRWQRRCKGKRAPAPGRYMAPQPMAERSIFCGCYRRTGTIKRLGGALDVKTLLGLRRPTIRVLLLYQQRSEVVELWNTTAPSCATCPHRPHLLRRADKKRSIGCEGLRGDRGAECRGRDCGEVGRCGFREGDALRDERTKV
jgi:hypothetical protein